MGTDCSILLALVLSGAAWLTLHLMLLIRAAGAKALRPGLRALALLPPATPAVAWMAGSRALPVLWTAVGAAYLALWWLS
jgi:hypothetical protein